MLQVEGGNLKKSPLSQYLFMVMTVTFIAALISEFFVISMIPLGKMSWFFVTVVGVVVAMALIYGYITWINRM